MAQSDREQLIAQLEKAESQNQALQERLDRTEETLKIYQGVLDSIPIRVFWKDRKSIYLGANTAFLQDAKCQSQTELSGKDDYALPWKQGEAYAFRCDDKEVVESGISKLNIEEPQTRSDGVVGWLRTNKIPLKDKQGEVIGVIGTYEDITEKKNQSEALRQSEARFKALFDGTFQFIGILSPDGRIQMVNATVAKRFELDPQKVVGQYFPDTPFWLHDMDERDKIIEAIKRAAQGEQVRQYAYHQTPTGEIIYVDFSLTPVFNREGQVEMLIPEGRDITAQRLAELQLKELNENLEQRVVNRTAELERANRELTLALEHLKLTQDELIQSEKLASLGGLVSGFAHEVNTPLGVGVTAASLLQEELKILEQQFHQSQLTRSKFEKFFNTSKESSAILSTNLERASELIRSFKRVAVEQSAEELHTIELMEFINEVMQSLNPQLRKRGVSSQIDGPKKLHSATYPGAIAQILTNLVMNSIIHAFAEKEAPQISIRVQTLNDSFELVYADNGCGMEEETRQKVFDPFYTTKRNEGGSGLGMNIVFNLVTQKLKGTVSCKSELGSGSQFILQLPLNLMQQPENMGENNGR